MITCIDMFLVKGQLYPLSPRQSQVTVNQVDRCFKILLLCPDFHLLCIWPSLVDGSARKEKHKIQHRFTKCFKTLNEIAIGVIGNAGQELGSTFLLYVQTLLHNIQGCEGAGKVAEVTRRIYSRLNCRVSNRIDRHPLYSILVLI